MNGEETRIEQEEQGEKTASRMPWPVLVLMGFGSLLIAVLLIFVIASAQSQLFYAVLSVVFLVGGGILSQRKGGVVSMLVALPLIVAGFASAFICARDEYLTLVMVLQMAVSAVLFYLSKSEICRHVLLAYIVALAPGIAVSIVDSFRAVSFWVVIAYTGVYAGTTWEKVYKRTEFEGYLGTVRFVTAVIVAVSAFLISEEHIYSIAIAAVSFAMSCVLLRKYLTGTKLAVGVGLALLACAATACYPVMAVGFLGVMLSYAMLEYLTLVIFGGVFVAGVSMFYYDLDMLLIDKSYLLMASGLVFLTVYCGIKRLAK
ncbi:MAG: DUF4401 domain-containing protein [Bacteroidales bacterium]|nr:DUF4401 domain-containing protein [Bacteroidales bacterium]